MGMHHTANVNTAWVAANGNTAGTYTGREKRTSGPAALVENKLTEPGLKFTDWRASSGERWAVAGAKMREKMVYMSASMKIGVYRMTHPLHPVRRKSAEEMAKNKKSAATERRKQAEAVAHGRQEHANYVRLDYTRVFTKITSGSSYSVTDTFPRSPQSAPEHKQNGRR